MSNYYVPEQHRKRSAVSSQSSCDESGPPAKRVYSSSTSYDNNVETSSQSEAETSQLSDNTVSSDSESETGGSDEDPARSAEGEQDADSAASPTHSNDRVSFSAVPLSSAEDDLSYRSSADQISSGLLGGGGVAAKLMAQMGYQTGTGLGKHAQGRVAPVETSKQKGRRGLGMAPSNFELESDLAWREEEVSCTEPVEWMEPLTLDIPDMDELRSWLIFDKKKLTIDDETEFVDPEVLSRVLGSKSVFDDLEGEEMRKARTHSNPFELIRGVMFQNRAAMKMANIDALFDFMFTSPKDRNGAPLVKSGELLYFADICAGPGGFSEYVLWRKKWKCKGYGLTLKSGPGVNDFKLEEFFVSPSECFEPHYGKGGVEGDGDIYNQENIDIFASFVKDNTKHKGVHFVMADGGFSVEGQENVQEVLSKRLYLCQFLCAISILRDGGHFVCKLFDVFTPFSVGLVYLMRFVFDEVCLMKPVTSRPANSERYIVCKGFKPTPGEVLREYLTYINNGFNHVNFGSVGQEKCIQHIIPIEVLKADDEFFDYIYKSNCELGRQQCLNLKKIQVYAKNPDLRDSRQMDIRAQCLELWKVPDKLRSAPDKVDPAAKVNSLLQTHNMELLGQSELCDMERLKKEIRSIYDFKVFVSGTRSVTAVPSLHYFLSMGRAMVFMSDGSGSSSWKRVSDNENFRLNLDIPRDTLFVAEIVQELKGEGKGQKRLLSLHITDVLFLYGEDYRMYSYNARLDAAQLFVTAITKPSRTRLTPVRVKQLYRMEDLPSLLSNSLDYKCIKGFGSEPKLCYTGDFHNQEACSYAFAGLHFIPYMCKPWTMAYSRGNRRKYFYNSETKKSVFETAKQAFANTSYSLKHRLLLTDKNVCTRIGLGNLTIDLDEWMKNLAPWLGKT